MKLKEAFKEAPQRPYIIAEVSQNHDGSLGQAHAFIDAVADAGADAIKFQTHIADEESTRYEPFRVKFSYEDETRYDYWKRMEFTEPQWEGLFHHAEDRGLEFLSSPFSPKALEMLDRIGIPGWKFGAGEVFNRDLLKLAADTGKPMLLSTGLSTFFDISETLKMIQPYGNEVLLFHCVTAYPSTADMIDIRLVSEMIRRFPCKVGISDHSATIYPSLAAMALGASAVEVHVTLSPYMFGPDVKASVDLRQLKEIVEGAVFITKMLNTETNMECRDARREELKQMFSKSLFAADDLTAGTILTERMFKAKKPCIGIPSDQVSNVVGKCLKRDIGKDEPIHNEDLIE